MTAIQALRKEVKQYIDKADDKALRMVKAILEIEQEEDESKLEEENWDDLPRELQLSIEKGIKDGEEGRVISHEDMKKKYSQWFRK